MLSSSLKRSSSLGRLAADEDDDYRYKMAIEKLRCDLVGFPYCCNKHYTVYRRPPYSADLDYPYYRWCDRGQYWPDWPYYNRRPWFYDDYYRDYVRGYEEGLKKYDTKIRRSASSADLADIAGTRKLDRQPFASAAAAASAEEPSATAASTARARTPPPPPPPPPPPQSSVPPYYDRPYYDRSYYDRSYYDRYYQPYWYYNYYYRPPYYWRRYLDSRAI